MCVDKRRIDGEGTFRRRCARFLAFNQDVCLHALSMVVDIMQQHHSIFEQLGRHNGASRSGKKNPVNIVRKIKSRMMNCRVAPDQPMSKQIVGHRKSGDIETCSLLIVYERNYHVEGPKV